MKALFKPTSTGLASALIAAATFISYVIGLARDKTMAHFFGTSVQTDIYNSAFIIPDIILNICIAGALSGVFIPIYIEHLNRSTKEAEELSSIFLSVMSTFLIIVSVTAFIFADTYAAFVVPETAAAGIRGEVATMMRLMLLNPLLLGLARTFSAILQSHQHFVSYSIAIVLYNVGIIAGVMLFHESFGIYSAGIGVLIGSFLQMLVGLLEIRTLGVGFSFNLNVKHPGFRKILLYMNPRIITLLSLQFVIREFSVVGYTLEEGALAASAFARNFQSFSISLFGVAIATAVLPALSKFAAKKDEKNYTARFERSLTQILFYTLPAAVGMILVSSPLISVFLRGGAFDEQSLIMTGTLLVIFSLSIPLEGLMHLYSRAFYSRTKILIPTIASLLFASAAIVGIHLLKDTVGIYSFAWGWVAGTTLQTLFLMIVFHGVKGYSGVSWKSMLTIIKVTIASALMGLAVYGISLLELGSLLTLMTSVTVGALLYIVLCYVLRVQEVTDVKDLVYRRLLKKK